MFCATRIRVRGAENATLSQEHIPWTRLGVPQLLAGSVWVPAACLDKSMDYHQGERVIGAQGAPCPRGQLAPEGLGVDQTADATQIDEKGLRRS